MYKPTWWTNRTKLFTWRDFIGFVWADLCEVFYDLRSRISAK